MTKQTNPFITMQEAIAELENLGTNPLAQGATYPFPWGNSYASWQENILSIAVDKVYPPEGNHYYVMRVQLINPGFNDLINRLNQSLERGQALKVGRRRCGLEHDELSIEITPQLGVFTLVPKEQEERAE